MISSEVNKQIKQLILFIYFVIHSPLCAVEVHSFLSFVVGSDPEGNDLHRGETRGHGENFPSVGGIVQVLLGFRMRHACRVAADDVKV